MIQASIPIIVARDNSAQAPPITVLGYDVTGHVMSEGEPIKDVHFMLFSDTVSKEVREPCACMCPSVKVCKSYATVYVSHCVLSCRNRNITLSTGFSLHASFYGEVGA